jgi:hypothetical protein
MPELIRQTDVEARRIALAIVRVVLDRAMRDAGSAHRDRPVRAIMTTRFTLS